MLAYNEGYLYTAYLSSKYCLYKIIYVFLRIIMKLDRSLTMLIFHYVYEYFGIALYIRGDNIISLKAVDKCAEFAKPHSLDASSIEKPLSREVLWPSPIVTLKEILCHTGFIFKHPAEITGAKIYRSTDSVNCNTTTVIFFHIIYRLSYIIIIVRNTHFTISL